MFKFIKNKVLNFWTGANNFKIGQKVIHQSFLCRVYRQPKNGQVILYRYKIPAIVYADAHDILTQEQHAKLVKPELY